VEILETMTKEMPVETRAVSLRFAAQPKRSRGVLTRSLMRTTIQTIARQGFNAVVLNCFGEGYCLFPSEVAVATRLVKVHPLFRRADTFLHLIEEIGAAGLVLYAELDALLLGQPDTPGVRYALKKHPAWLMRNREHDESPIGDDTENVYLCPSHPEVKRLFGRMLNELAEQYPISGAVLRFQRLPQETASLDATFCFCKACAQTIHDELNIELDILEISESSPAYHKWQEWSEKQFYEYLENLKMRFNKVRRGAPFFSLAPRGALNDTQNSLYGRVLRRALTDRLLDGILIADYSGDPEAFSQEMSDDSATLGSTALFFPMLPPPACPDSHVGAGWEARRDAVPNGRQASVLHDLRAAMQRFVSVARQQSVPGFLCAEMVLEAGGEKREAGSEGEDQVTFGESALVAEVNPEVAVAQLSREIIDIVGEESSLGGFLRDMNTLLSAVPKRGTYIADDAGEAPSLAPAQLESLAENLGSIEQKLSDGALEVPGDVARIRRNLRLIQRLLWFLPVAER
jgi:hypothetical protein